MKNWAGNGYIFEGTKGKLIGNYSELPPRLLPHHGAWEKWKQYPQTLERVPEGHYVQWVNGCMKGYEKAKLSSPFSYAGPFTEAVLMGNPGHSAATNTRKGDAEKQNPLPGQEKATLGCQKYENHQLRPGQFFRKKGIIGKGGVL